MIVLAYSGMCFSANAASSTAPGAPYMLYEDAGRPAMDWSLKNPGIAVAVLLGTESKFTPAQVQSGLRGSFAEAGVTDLMFFYEQNDMPSTGVVYYYSGASDGPFILNEAQVEAKKSAKQYLFQQGNPITRYEYPD